MESHSSSHQLTNTLGSSFPARAGFTLVELLVVLAIIMIITAVAFTNQGSFNKTLILANTAYDIALTIRSAETYGIGSRATGTDANTGYGVHFSNGTPGSFILFADAFPGPDANNCHGLPVNGATAPNAIPGNCSYDSAQNERVTNYTLGNSIVISDFCAYQSGSWSCANSGNRTLTSLDIVFSRPNPDPFISVNGAYSGISPITDACLTLSSSSGGARYLSVTRSGSIAANASSCP